MDYWSEDQGLLIFISQLEEITKSNKIVLNTQLK